MGTATPPLDLFLTDFQSVDGNFQTSPKNTLTQFYTQLSGLPENVIPTYLNEADQLNTQEMIRPGDVVLTLDRKRPTGTHTFRVYQIIHATDEWNYFYYRLYLFSRTLLPRPYNLDHQLFHSPLTIFQKGLTLRDRFYAPARSISANYCTLATMLLCPSPSET